MGLKDPLWGGGVVTKNGAAFLGAVLCFHECGSELDLRSKLDDSVWWNAEELSGRSSVSRHQDEDLLPPARHAQRGCLGRRATRTRLWRSLPGDENALASEVESRVHLLR